MIRVTLRDGTRTQIAAGDIDSVEPDGRGAIVHLLSGEALSVVQDARMIEVRLRAALAEAEPEPEPEKQVGQPVPTSPASRVKRLLASRTSLGALVIGGFRRRKGHESE